MNTVDQLLKQAVAMQQGGRLPEAQALCREVLALDRDNFEALRLSGRAHIQQGQIQSGIAMLSRALVIQPGETEVRYELGRAFHVLGQTRSALECFDECLASKPGYAEAHNARGIMLSKLGRNTDASGCFLQAIAINPQFASAHNNLGNEYLHLGRHEDALTEFSTAIDLRPDLADAWNGRGDALLFLNRHPEALDSFARALALDANLTEAWNGYGIALSNLRRYREASVSFQHALAAQPDNPQTLCNVGELLIRTGRQMEAIELFNRALAIRPDFELALTKKGSVLMALGRQEEAIRTFQENLDFHPDNPRLMSAFLFDLNFVARMSAGEVFAWHRKFGERFEAPLKSRWRAHPNLPDPHRPLRVGFVSGDFRGHPVGYFMEGVLSSLDRETLHLYAYANQAVSDAVTDRLRSHFRTWRDIRALSDEEAASQIRADAIDILIDLAGHTQHNRLLSFARKPAPVQVTYLGYFSSTGLTAMDYFLADHWQMPEGSQAYYTETPYRLPHRLLRITHPDQHLPVGPLPAGYNGFVTFGNFNKLEKMSNATVSCWAGILNGLPGSRLFFKTDMLEGHDIAQSVRERFARHGIAGDRLILEGKSSLEAYLKSFQRVDIALDPFPYAGGTITADSLWMGVPVLTMQGDRHVGRGGASIMQTIGMPEWVAADEAEYIARGVAMATDLTALEQTRAGLRDRYLSSPLCDTESFARNLERALREIWRRWCDGAAPGAPK